MQLFLFFSSWYCVCQPFCCVRNFALLPKFELFCYKFNDFFDFFFKLKKIILTNFLFFFARFLCMVPVRSQKIKSGCLILFIFNSQNWPNPLVDDHYNNHSTKLSKKGKKCVCVCVYVFFGACHKCLNLLKCNLQVSYIHSHKA